MKLRPFDEKDAEDVAGWFSDEIGFRKWCSDQYDHFPVNAGDIVKFYSEKSANGDFFPMTAQLDGKAVGHLIMCYKDEQKSVIRLGYIVLSPEMRGKGMGRKMISAALSMAFGEMGAKSVNLGVFENNPPAYRCYTSLGFENTGDFSVHKLMGEEWKCLELELTYEKWVKDNEI